MTFFSFISKQFTLPVIFSKVSTDILICLNENITWWYSSVLHLMSLWCTAQATKKKRDELQDVMSRKSGGGAIEKCLWLFCTVICLFICTYFPCLQSCHLHLKRSPILDAMWALLLDGGGLTKTLPCSRKTRVLSLNVASKSSCVNDITF